MKFNLVEDRPLELLEGGGVEGNVIKGVKMVGLNSPTRNRRYSESGLSASVELYEGKPANIGHLKPEGNREKGDTTAIAGQYRNVRMVEGKGLYGDMHLIPDHPMTNRILWAAENAPNLFCLSHHAGGRGRVDGNGVQVIESITTVMSVDVVGLGGTTSSLFESADEEDELKELSRLTEKYNVAGMSPSDTTTVEESEMDISKLTLSELRESRKDLVDQILQEAADDDAVKALRDENKELKAKIDAQEAAKVAEAKKAERNKLIEEAKLPEMLVTEAFREDVLDINTSDERAARLIEDRKALMESLPKASPKSSAKQLFEQAGKGGEGKGPATTDELVEALNK